VIRAILAKENWAIT
jgi:hypothetical protein